MKLIPAVSIMDGRVVVADGGTYQYVRNAEGQYRSPVNLIRETALPGEEMFILDIDGLERNSPNLDMVKKLAAQRSIWLDAGTPDSDSMMDLFVSDVSRVVLSTLTLDSLDELTSALEISDNVIFSVAYDSGVLSPNPSISGMGLHELLAKLKGLTNLKAAMLFDLGSLRDKKPIDRNAIAEVAGHFDELYVSGWFEPQELDNLSSAGVSGYIVDFRKLEGMQNE
ncbi:MAG: HisA/HisF-related TIM barrel protein [Thermoplasmata archaeon]|nr:HisA/HisF-related TIM barrel protein [Thermoplasmata archaeon]